MENYEYLYKKEIMRTLKMIISASKELLQRIDESMLTIESRDSSTIYSKNELNFCRKVIKEDVQFYNKRITKLMHIMKTYE